VLWVHPALLELEHHTVSRWVAGNEELHRVPPHLEVSLIQEVYDCRFPALEFLLVLLLGQVEPLSQVGPLSNIEEQLVEGHERHTVDLLGWLLLVSLA
jgi:hypothetical protein